jgi:phosphohistidine phosphatase
VPLQEIYLARHGQAASTDQNRERRLTAQGRAQVEKATALLKQLELHVDIIYHSSKRRAAETAELLSGAIAPAHGVKSRAGLNPDDAVSDALRDLMEEGFDRVMIVGHLPFLERLASLLLLGKPHHKSIRFAESSVAALTHREEGWEVRWMIQPPAKGQATIRRE